MVNKRKWDELSDSESDDVAPGKQILPVANLPPDFDQEPQDGLQYLFLVRRDARRLPYITRVKNPYELTETNVSRKRTHASADFLPRERWRSAFQSHFSNLKRNLTQATIHVGSHSGPRHKVIPEKKNRDGWWKFLAGYHESAWTARDNFTRKKFGAECRMRTSGDPAEAVFLGSVPAPPDVQSRSDSVGSLTACFDASPPKTLRRPSPPELAGGAGLSNAASFAVGLLAPGEAQGQHMEHTEKLSPPEVTPSYLREIDHRMSLHLLMYFTHWINNHLQNPGDPLTRISVSHGQWIFALLTKVEDEVSADEMSLLRNLARACLGLIQRSGGEHDEKDAIAEGDIGSVRADNGAHISNASCWMVFTAIAGHWGQKDLWTDAEDALAMAG